LQGGSAIPWIPDPEAAAKYDKDSCSENPLVGIAVDHYRRTNFNGDGEYDVVVLTCDINGKKTDVAIHCQPTVLADQMRKARPRGGEEVGVVYNGKKPGTRGNDYGDYRVVVEREASGDFAWSAGDGEPQREVYDNHSSERVTVPAAPQHPVSQHPEQHLQADDDIPF
jgi:hypothetical protein